MEPAGVRESARTKDLGWWPLAATLLISWTLSCARAAGGGAGAADPPEYLLGSFVDDYESDFTLTKAEFVQHPRSKYRIVRWDLAGEFFVAENDFANPSDGGRWTRVDWVRLEGMAPWGWAFCFSAWKAETRAAAESTSVAQRATLRTGCAGHPFSRMKRQRREAPAN